MKVNELITELQSYDCANNDVIGFLEDTGEFELKPIKYIQDDGESYIVISSKDFDPFKEKDAPDELAAYEYRNIVEYVSTFEKVLACKKMLVNWIEGKLDYTPNNSFELSLMQYNNMLAYANTHYFRIGMHFKSRLPYLIEDYVDKHRSKYPNVVEFISNTGKTN